MLIRFKVTLNDFIPHSPQQLLKSQQVLQSLLQPLYVMDVLDNVLKPLDFLILKLALHHMKLQILRNQSLLPNLTILLFDHLRPLMIV